MSTPTWIGIALFFAACLGMLIGAMITAPEMEEDVPPCPEQPFEPRIKHKAVKDRLAMGNRRLHAREVAELDQQVHRG